MSGIFFVTSSILTSYKSQIPHCPNEIRLWQETMYVQFGQKWSKLHHSPLWSGGEDSQMGTMKVCVYGTLCKYNFMQCYVGMLRFVSMSLERTLRRSINASGVTLTPEIQVSGNIDIDICSR